MSSLVNQHLRAATEEQFLFMISAVKPQNSVSHWNCQDYVIEALEKLEEECVIDDDEKAYISAKKQVKKHFGPL